MKIIRSIPPVLRLLLTLVVTGFAGLVAWQFGGDLFWTLTVSVTLFLVAEFWVFHRSLVISLIPILLHLLFSTLYVSFVVNTLGLFQTPAGFVLWTAIALHAIQLAVAGLYPFVARMYSQGRVVVNLIVSLLLYNAALIMLTAYAKDLSFIMASGIAAVIGLGWLVLRAYFPLERKSESQQQGSIHGLPTSRHTTSLYATLDRLTGQAGEQYHGARLYRIGSRWWAVAATYVEDALSLDERGFKIDGEDHSASLPALLDAVASFSQERKVKDTLIQACIIITPSSKFPQEVLATRVASARNPDRNLGTVTLLSADRLERLMKRQLTALGGSQETADSENTAQ